MSTPQQISTAIACLRSGEVIITPSESCYGFSCDALNESAVAKLNALKERTNMALTVLVADLDQMSQFSSLNETARTLSRHFHPAPLNLIVDFDDPAKYTYLSENGIAFRTPQHPILLELTRQCGPITTTSANRHGEPALYRFSDVSQTFRDAVCSILNAGDLDASVLPSTVYDTRSHVIVRNGPISEAMIRSVL